MASPDTAGGAGHDTAGGAGQSPPPQRPALGAVRRAFAPWNDAEARPLIRFEAVTKTFGTTRAVDAVSLDIHEREFFALLGPSGCGKTTLMRMLAGFEQPTSGRIVLDGVDLADTPPHRRPVNMMFQSYALFPHMDVARNVAFGLEMDGVAKPEIARRVEETLKLVQLAGFGERRPDQLSGGQRQRVALARALIKRPRVLLLDEPLGALDKKLREETQFELMDLQVQLGMTFLVVTHDQEEAMTMSDRIAVMDAGRIVQVATPSEMYERPGSRYVAEFLGDVTVFDCTVEALSEGRAVLRAGPPLDASFVVIPDEPIDVGQAVTLAVRPEKMRILHADEAAPAGMNTLSGTVWDIGYQGDWTTYLVDIGTARRVRVARANVARIVERPIGWDDPVTIAFAPEAGVALTR